MKPVIPTYYYKGYPIELTDNLLTYCYINICVFVSLFQKKSTPTTLMMHELMSMSMCFVYILAWPTWRPRIWRLTGPAATSRCLTSIIPLIYNFLKKLVKLMQIQQNIPEFQTPIGVWIVCQPRPTPSHHIVESPPPARPLLLLEDPASPEWTQGTKQMRRARSQWQDRKSRNLSQQNTPPSYNMNYLINAAN